MSRLPNPLRSSPPRPPLHERSDSHTNSVTSPTLRVIGDPGAPISSSTPYPTHPSHILPPKRQGYVFEDEESVSQADSPTDDLGQEQQEPRSSKSKGKEIASATNTYNGSHLQPSTMDMFGPTSPFSQDSERAAAAGVTADTRLIDMDQGIDEDERLSDEIVQLPSVPSRIEALGSPSFMHGSTANINRQPVAAKSSDNSLSSAESTGTVVRPKGRVRGSYSAFPSHVSGFSNSSRDSFPTPSRVDPGRPEERIPPASAGSWSASDDAYPEGALTGTRHASSGPMYANVQASSSSDVSLQYPVIRPPTASGSWAESTRAGSSRNVPKRPPRTFEHHPDRWNPHLSTVESIGTTDFPNPPTLPSPRRSRNATGSTIRVVTERDDNVPEMLSPIPGSRDSGFRSFFSRDPSQRRSAYQTRPGRRGSFLRDSIPAWAKAYYARSRESISELRPQTADPSASAISLGVTRPRTRPREGEEPQVNRDSMRIEPAEPAEPVEPVENLQPSGATLVEIQGQPRRKVSQIWSPHLWHDRRTIGRRSLFVAPSLDEEAEGHAMSRRTAQIVLFALGFVFPIAWFVASFLPLPPRPTHSEKEPVGARISRATMIRDLEKALDPVDERRYENARWWRSLNRLMSMVGVLIVAAIIALAVIAT